MSELIHIRSMDLGKELDEKLSVRYIGGMEEKERRKKKRKEAFMVQVKSGVRTVQVLNSFNQLLSGV